MTNKDDSFITRAVEHLVRQMNKNGCLIKSNDEVERVREMVKDGLYRLEQHTFIDAMKWFNHKIPPAPPHTHTLSGLSASDIQVYESGAFNLLAFAPGGIQEVGPDRRPVNWEPPVRMPTGNPVPVMPSLGGKPFRCTGPVTGEGCGANVFESLGKNAEGVTHYRCNGCGTVWVGEAP